MSMTTRYAHLSQEHKKKAVNLLNGLTAPQQPTNEKCHILSHFDNHQNVTNGLVVDITGLPSRSLRAKAGRGEIYPPLADSDLASNSSSDLRHLRSQNQSRFLANARPEGLFRYASNSSALWRSEKATAVLTCQGLYLVVCGFFP